MTEYTVTISPTRTWVNFAPVTQLEEVKQNIRTIATTALGSAPGSRSIGVEWELVDEPINITKSRITGMLMAAIAEQEPRAQITRIDFYDEQDAAAGMYGRLVPIIRFILAEGET
ncbi:lysozyme [Brevibacillus fulvus]|uniref:Phage baseplate assembly protein W n=1 Tax=Brevibacillus fulvus TaxID=1125967 RepID=A0A939BTW2_9BACL|nr:lysozyme [Brevibacillus fulvus]MBM7592247.1 phage baseplate assembly protein W [Brevibacillus fulvus]